MTTVTDRMKAARVLANLSQQELADRLGVSVGTVKRRESGDSAANPEVLMALAQATGVPLSWIISGFTAEQTEEPLEVSLRRLGEQDNASQ
jgi:transcriptional regulator with XRE-family HTH domain